MKDLCIMRYMLRRHLAQPGFLLGMNMPALALEPADVGLLYQSASNKWVTSSTGSRLWQVSTVLQTRLGLCHATQQYFLRERVYGLIIFSSLICSHL